MTNRYEGIIGRASVPLEPIATGVEPRLPRLEDIRAVLLDIYGTLLVSASGDIGATDPGIRGAAFAAAMQAVGITFTGNPDDGASLLRQEISSDHDRRRTAGVKFPEIEIDAVWRQVCKLLHERGALAEVPSNAECANLAIEFEVRVNPVWPMPGFQYFVERLVRSGVVMGIISNAQFFTPLVFPAIVGKSLDQLGFDAELRYYSYEHGCAKPGRELFEMAAQRLATMELAPHEALYVGNDMRNDIWPAGEVGFRTALFAGDRRSLRMRSEDVNCQLYGKPDAIVTELMQIPTILNPSAETR